MYVLYDFDPSPPRTHSPPPLPLFRVDRANEAGQVTRGKDGRAADGHGAGRVLLIYTGGTMGMTVQNGSLTPLKGYLPKCIVDMPEVHHYLSLPYYS